MTDNSSGKTTEQTAQQACDSTLSRKEFISKVVTRGAATGAIFAGYKIVDKFMVPPAYAQASGSGGLGPLPTVGAGSDSVTLPGPGDIN